MKSLKGISVNGIAALRCRLFLFALIDTRLSLCYNLLNKNIRSPKIRKKYALYGRICCGYGENAAWISETTSESAAASLSRAYTFIGVMLMTVGEKVLELARLICAIDESMSAARTDDAKEEPRAGESDVDIFVFCSEIPPIDTREAVYRKAAELGVIVKQMCVCENCVWGTGDMLEIDGVDVMPMYFTKRETDSFASEIAAGKRVYNEGGFYPVGRLMSFIQMTPLCGDGYAGSLKAKWQTYSEKLRRAMISEHMGRLWQDEDFTRASQRRDPVYLHQVLESALDSALLVLYAVNRTYFPSRKRTEKFINGFEIKPENFYARLLRVLSLAAFPESVPEAVSEWKALGGELQRLAEGALSDSRYFDVYDGFPPLSGERFTLRIVRESDAEDLLSCYSDEKALPLFNADNCSRGFYMKTADEVRQYINIWLWEYGNRGYARCAAVDNASGKAVGTIELFDAGEKNGIEHVGILRLDLASGYENKRDISDILRTVIRKIAFAFGLNAILTKAPEAGAARRELLSEIGFRETENGEFVPFDDWYFGLLSEIRL